MSDEMKKALACMQEAIDEELEHKAKLGFKVVVGDKNGNPKVLSARYVLRKSRRNEN
jgi:hypothetical protein